MIQANYPEIEKRQYYTFGKYKKKAINQIVQKYKEEYIKSMEERSIEQIFPYQSIKAKIDRKIIIGRFKPSDLDRVAGKVNLYKLRMEVQKFNKVGLRRGEMQEEKRWRYNKKFNSLKKRVDRINQSVMTAEKIKLERARIAYRIAEEEWKRIKGHLNQIRPEALSGDEDNVN